MRIRAAAPILLSDVANRESQTCVVAGRGDTALAGDDIRH